MNKRSRKVTQISRSIVSQSSSTSARRISNSKRHFSYSLGFTSRDFRMARGLQFKGRMWAIAPISISRIFQFHSKIFNKRIQRTSTKYARIYKTRQVGAKNENKLKTWLVWQSWLIYDFPDYFFERNSFNVCKTIPLKYLKVPIVFLR